MPRIDGERLIADLRELRGFGACGTGVVRQSLTPVDVESRHWLVNRMTAAGLDARIDGIGSVIGRSTRDGKALLIGSHTDTQPTGGWLDGAMGVIYGLEVARAFRESNETAHLAIDVASWIDEEGTFYSLLGSRAFCGELPEAALDTATDPDGRLLSDALAEAGLGGEELGRLDPERYVAYLEAHIEQGPYLEMQQKRIGVVTAIVGIRQFLVRFTGQQNHAGTTPMPMRKDAGMALIGLAHAIDSEFRRKAGPRTVWTVGDVTFEPGAASIVPGRAEMILQFRDPEEGRLDALETVVRDLVSSAVAEGSVEIELCPSGEAARAAELDAGLRRHLAAAAEKHAPDLWVDMPSGAGHDAQVLARRLPSAMLFVPSIGGVSHAFAEDTDEADIILGCRVLATAAEMILLGREG